MLYKGLSLSLLIFLLLFVVFSGATSYGKEVVVGLLEEPPTLDPFQLQIGAVAWEISLALHVYPFLIGLDGQLIPDAAKSWEIIDDTILIFYLRDDILFHDGSQLTAKDFIYTLNAHLDLELGSFSYHTLHDTIDSIEMIDDYTVKIQLKHPYGPIFYSLLFPIVPKESYEQRGEDFSTSPIGAGPFKIVEWSLGEHLILEAYEGFYQGRPFLDRVSFRFLEYPLAYDLFLKEELDILNVRTVDLGPIEEDPRFGVARKPGASWYYIGVNQTDGPLSHKNVRQAISYAINRKEIIETLFYGEMIPATGPIVPLSWAYNPYVKIYDYNPARSVRLLVEAGFPDGFAVELKCSPYALPYMEIIQEQLKRVNIAVELLPLEWQQLSRDLLQNNFQLHYRAWVGQTDPERAINRQFMGGSNINIAGYANRELDELAYRATMTLDLEKRREYYYEIQEILAEELPAIFLWYGYYRFAYNRRVMDFDVDPYYSFRLFAHMWVE